MMREIGVQLSAAQVRALLEGRMSEFRLPVTPQPELIEGYWRFGGAAVKDPRAMLSGRCPYRPGDRMWVKETWRLAKGADGQSGPEKAKDFEPELGRESWPYLPVRMEADGRWHGLGVAPEFAPTIGRLRQARFMPQWASRFTLEVVGSKAERLDDITTAGIRAEGIDDGYTNAMMGKRHDAGMRMAFDRAWDSIYGKRTGLACRDNPWVWVVRFRQVAS